jgi:hypothetical protein
LPGDYALACEVLRCRRLIKGYSDTHSRGLSKYDRVMAGIALVAFSRFHLNATGQTFVIFVLTVAAAEAAMGLALVVLLFRRRESLDAQEWTELKG